MNAAYPLIRYGAADRIVAVRQKRQISAAAFLQDVAALAAMLPSHRHVVNLCADRYRFAVGLMAALRRGQLSLLPPNDTPGILEQLVADFPDLYCLGDGRAAEPPITWFGYPDEKVDREETVPPPSVLPGGQPAVSLFTSGSTGRPKPQLKSWGSLVRSARAAGERLEIASLPGATVVGTVPHQHSYGLESTVLLPLQHGLALQAERPFYPGDICAALDRIPRPRILVTTPIHLRALMAERGELPAADLVISATAPLSEELAVEVEGRFRAPLREIYGCSEAGQLAVRRTAQSPEWRCLDGVVLRQNEQGTWASGDAVETETLLQDIIELRGAGRFLLHGRSADLVNIAGKRTSLAYLNHHLNAIAGVKDGVFVASEDAGDRVARLVAFVVAPDVPAESIMNALRRHIDAAFLPRPLVFVDSLPRNATGKLPREALLRLAPRTVGAGGVWHAREVRFAANHATAAGHFPGNPIIPGAVLLDEVLYALNGGAQAGLGPCVIRSAKFLEPVRPGDAILIRWAARERETKFECLLLHSDRMALTGTVEKDGAAR